MDRNSSRVPLSSFLCMCIELSLYLWNHPHLLFFVSFFPFSLLSFWISFVLSCSSLPSFFPSFLPPVFLSLSLPFFVSFFLFLETSFASIPSVSSQARGGGEGGATTKKRKLNITGAWSSASLLHQTRTSSASSASSAGSDPSSSAVEDDESIRNLFSRKEEIVTLQIFSTGNVTLTGGRAVESMEYALQCIIPFLQQCQVISHHSNRNSNSSSHSHPHSNSSSLQFNRHSHAYL